MTGTLYFDGVCGMCTRAVNRLAELDRTGDLRIRPFQEPGTAALLGVSPTQMLTSMWWLDSSGAVYSGAHAMNAALSAALGSRVPLYIYRIPGVGAVQRLVYRWVAAHRYRFPGMTPYCESSPTAC
jgi:predicted DCC family thiol-disulfide oxidoreductase YuxK